jgi:hypothetical protein
MISDIVEFYENLLALSYFDEDRTTITGNLYKGLHAALGAKGGEFPHEEFPGYLGYHGKLGSPTRGLTSQPLNHKEESFAMTLSASHLPQIPVVDSR